MSYDDFLSEAAERDVSRIDALVSFVCWYWTSVSGGLAWYMEQNPEALFIPDSDYALVCNEALLKLSIDDCLRRYRGDGFGYLGSFSADEITDAVVLAWQGGFGDLPPLEDDPGYAAWEQRVLRTGGHKICDVCRKSFPLDVKFCGQCGRSLPDVYFFDDDIEADIARYQLATERGCDMKDVPYDDVRARIPVIANHMDY